MNDLQRAISHTEGYLDARAHTVFPYNDEITGAGPTRLLVSELRDLVRAARAHEHQQRGAR